MDSGQVYTVVEDLCVEELLLFELIITLLQIYLIFSQGTPLFYTTVCERYLFV